MGSNFVLIDKSKITSSYHMFKCIRLLYLSVSVIKLALPKIIPSNSAHCTLVYWCYLLRCKSKNPNNRLVSLKASTKVWDIKECTYMSHPDIFQLFRDVFILSFQKERHIFVLLLTQQNSHFIKVGLGNNSCFSY